MSEWQKSEIGGSAAALGFSNELMNAVIAYGVSVRGQIPAGFGVFSTYDIQNDTVVWFFSPEAALLARQFRGTPTEKPTPSDGFGLLAGNQSSTMIHFPAYFSRHRGR